MANAQLYKAIYAGNLMVMQKAIMEGANLNEPFHNSEDRLYPIHIAAYKGTVRLMEELKNNNSSLEVKDKHGSTPLHTAALAGREGSVLWLLKQGVNCRILNHSGQLASDAARNNGHNELMTFLEECERNPESAANAARHISQMKLSGLMEEFINLGELNNEAHLVNARGKNYYQILGVQEGANDNEIKKAYRNMALDHHPDRHVNASDIEIQEHKEKFQDIWEAYAVLSDTQKRSIYDSGEDIDIVIIFPSQIFQKIFGHEGLFGGEDYMEYKVQNGSKGASFSRRFN